MLKSVVAAAIILAAAPAYAEMVCHMEPGLGRMPGETVMNKVCEDKEAGHKAWVQLYCSNHPADPNCAALGYHYTSTDPIDQRVDQRLVDRACAVDTNAMQCISPFKGAQR